MSKHAREIHLVVGLRDAGYTAKEHTLSFELWGGVGNVEQWLNGKIKILENFFYNVEVPEKPIPGAIVAVEYWLTCSLCGESDDRGFHLYLGELRQKFDDKREGEEETFQSLASEELIKNFLAEFIEMINIIIEDVEDSQASFELPGPQEVGEFSSLN